MPIMEKTKTDFSKFIPTNVDYYHAWKSWECKRIPRVSTDMEKVYNQPQLFLDLSFGYMHNGRTCIGIFAIQAKK